VVRERTGRDPMVQRRRLRTELRQARNQAGLTQRDVALAMDWSPSKLIRIESGAVSISKNDLQALLRHYGVEDRDRVESLVEMARASRTPSWSSYKDIVGPGFITMLGYESSASLIRQFEPGLVPGLLQTEEYARDVLKRAYLKSDAEAEKLWNLREQRQGLHDRRDPPEMFFVMDEAVVRRLVGGPRVMRRQLERLRDLADRPHITILIIPFSKGAHLGLTGPFVVLEFPEATDPDLVYLENARGDSVYRDEPDESARYLEMFWSLEGIALDPDASRILLDKIIAELGDLPISVQNT
jgi:transcriptional regulator with XRE-family HTH domain